MARNPGSGVDGTDSDPADPNRAQLTLILTELRVISRLLSIGLNVTDDIDGIRADEASDIG